MTRNRHKLPSSTQAIPTDKKVYLLDNGQEIVVPQKLNIRTTQVYWGIPMDEVTFSMWMSSFIQMQPMPWDGYAFAMQTYLPAARNYIHKKFLQSGAEWLVMLDSDVVPPPDFVNRLLGHNKKMAGGWYCKKAWDKPEERFPVVYDYIEEKDGVFWWNIRKRPGKGLEKVDGAGAGCWLMHRDVARAIGEEPYDMMNGGEDMSLCVKVRKTGFDIWIDWDLPCSHLGMAPY